MEKILIVGNIRSYHPEAGPVSLTLAPGERCYLQGSEKACNTMFEMLTGLKKPDEGTVTVLGQNPYTMPETERAAFRRDHIGAVPRGSGFLPELTLLEQVRLPMVLAGFSQEEIRIRIRKNAFGYLPLHDLYNPAGRCSQRTLALAGVLRVRVMAPPILILNAAFDHLSGKDAELVWQEMQAVLAENLAFLYLSSAPAPSDILWSETMQLSGR
ncbi:MAG: ATP-binding cassette domain-containing protein [Faecousia sp.]